MRYLFDSNILIYHLNGELNESGIVLLEEGLAGEGRQFLEQPTKKVNDPAPRVLLDRWRWERLSLAGLARAAQLPNQGSKLMSTKNMPRCPA